MPFLIYFLLSLAFAHSVYSQNDYESDVSLRARVAPKPKILGISFGDRLKDVENVFQDMGMKLLSEREPTSSSFIKLLTFQGLPQGLAVREGQSELLFFDDSLIRMDLKAPPTYTNFLLLRQQLFNSLGERFSIETQKESMDRFLQAHLSNLADNEYNPRTEKEIIEALERGQTYFFYSIADQQDQMNVTLSFSAQSTAGGKHIPELLLHYSAKDGIDQFKAYEDEVKIKILPE